MKKYLITGALALSLGGFLTSCHDSEIDYSSIAEAKQATFAENFVKFYGEIDPEQDWGFGESASSVSTRGVSANGNEWAANDRDDCKWKVPPKLTDEQKAVVVEYFQTVKNPEYQNPGWTDYFIQQVYKGGESPRAGYSPEKYDAVDGQTKIVGSQHMDHLAAINGDFVDHNNNFNKGDCGEYSNVLDYKGTLTTVEETYPVNDQTHRHADKINLMTSSTTASFGYFNSNGSIRRTEYTGLVSYTKIIEVLGSKANCLNDGWNRSFMGFDFEQMIDDQCYATEWVEGKEVSKNLTIWGEYYVNGVKQSNYVYQYNGQPVKMLSDQMNRYCGDKKTVTDAQLYSDERDASNNNAYLGKKLNTDIIDGLLADGYLPVDNKSLREWVKVGGCADGYYSDWIVTLTKAEHYGTPTTTPTTGGSTEYNESTTGTYLRRYVQNHKWVFCEDLGQASNRKDFDYNDLVFDAKIVQDYIVTITDGIEVSVVSNGDPYALITPLAAGGELTITVAGQNVHQMFGQGDATIINTIDADKESDVRSSGVSYAPQSAGRIDCQQTATYATSNILDIPINVRIYNEAFTTLARKGEAPHKIAVTPGTRWAQERVDINDAQPGFAEWVRNASYGTSFWSDEASENRYPYMPSDQYLTNDMTRQYLPDELISGQTTKTYSITPSSTETLVWSDLTGATTFGTEWDNTTKWIGYSTLAQNDPNGKAFGVGSVIRAYVIAENNFNIQFFSVTNDNQWTKLIEATSGNYDSHLSNGSGYIEYTVTQEALAAMQTNSFVVLGINFKLLGVTVDNTNARSSSTPEAATYTAPTLASGETSVYSSNSGIDLNATGETVNTGLTTVGENTEITVHGVGENANISVTTSDGTALETASSARTRAAAQTSFKFKVQSEAVAAKIRTSGIKVKLNSGSFKMYMVAAKISAYTPSASSTEDSEGTSLLASGPLNGTETIDKGKFSGVKINDEIRIYYTSLGQWYWQVITWEGLNEGYNYTINGWGATSINTNNNFKNETEKYIYIPIDNDGFVEMLTNRGIRIQCDQIVVDRIVLVKK